MCTNPMSQAGQFKFSPVNVAHPDGIITDYTENYKAYLMGDVNGDWDPNGPARPLRSEAPGPDAAVVSVPAMSASTGSEATIPLRVDNLLGKGVEAFQFDINYDPAVISPSQVAATIDGTLSSNMSVVSNSPTPGLLMVAVYGAYPANGDGVYVNLKFNVIGAPGTRSPLTLSNFSFNDGTDEVSTVSGKLKVDAATSHIIRGHVMTAQGDPIAGAIVSLTSIDGQQLFATSTATGNYEFGDLISGQTYILRAKARGYLFAPVTVSMSGNLVEVDLIAIQTAIE